MTGRQARRAAALAGVVIILAVGVGGLIRTIAAPGPVSRAERAHAIETGLRCPVCQGLSVADSPSTVAAGMRRIVAAQLGAGRSAQAIRDYFVARYGPWILLDPPRRGVGWFVWLAPFVSLAVGLAGIGWLLRRRRGPPEANLPLAAAELDRVSAALHAHLAGDPVVKDPIDNEQLASALTLLAAVREDPSSEAEAESYAQRRVLAALNAPPAEPLVQPLAGTLPPPPRRPRTRLRWAAVGATFAVVVAAMLVTAVQHRAPGAPPTGDAKLVTDLLALRADAQAHPRQAAPWLALGLADDAAGNLAQAYADYSRAAADAPNAVEPKLLIASVLIRGGSPQQAVALLQPLLAAHPSDAELLLTLGVAEHAAGDPPAAATLRRFLRLDPTSPQAADVRALLGAA